MDKSSQEILEVLSNFVLDSKAISCNPFGSGHINKTFEVKIEKAGYFATSKCQCLLRC